MDLYDAPVNLEFISPGSTPLRKFWMNIVGPVLTIFSRDFRVCGKNEYPRG